jgi:hypothetical protein
LAGALILGSASAPALAAAPLTSTALGDVKATVGSTNPVEPVHYRYRSGSRVVFFAPRRHFFVVRRHRPAFFFSPRPRVVFFARRHWHGW